MTNSISSPRKQSKATLSVLVMGLVVFTALVLLSFSKHVKTQANQNQTRNNGDSRSGDIILGTHYWGNAWPVTFWNSAEFHFLENDFLKIKEDGFNTVILAIPWNEFQSCEGAGKLRSIPMERLGVALETADRCGLRVGLRVSYYWDYYTSPSGDTCRTRNESRVLSEEGLSLWVDYLSSLYAFVSNYRAFSFAFLTWEDFWTPIGFMDESQAFRLEKSQQTGFQKWLAKHVDLSEVSKKYGTKFVSFDDVPIPERSSPAARLYFSFWDDWIVDVILLRAESAFPGISLEGRVDWDAIDTPLGRRSCRHDKQFQAKCPDWIAVYYAPFMFSDNKGDLISAKQALDRIVFMLDNISTASGGKRIFIDQFNFEDNTPGFEQATRIMPEEVPGFLQNLAPVLSSRTMGYALWTWKNYVCTPLYNANFELGLDGWTYEGASCQAEQTGDMVARLEEGGSLEQPLDAIKIDSSMIKVTPTPEVKFWARSETSEPSILSVALDDEQRTLTISSNGVFACRFTKSPSRTIRLSASRGSVLLDNVEIRGHVQRNGGRNENGYPGPFTEVIGKVNLQLGAKSEASMFHPAAHFAEARVVNPSRTDTPWKGCVGQPESGADARLTILPGGTISYSVSGLLYEAISFSCGYYSPECASISDGASVAVTVIQGKEKQTSHFGVPKSGYSRHVVPLPQSGNVEVILSVSPRTPEQSESEPSNEDADWIVLLP